MKSCIVFEALVLYRHLYSITILSAFIEIVLLKIESLLRKPVSVEEVMDFIRNVESIDPRGIYVVYWICFSSVHFIVEIKRRRAL